MKDIEKGMLLCAVGSQQLSNRFVASIYFLTKAEGGRSKPITSKYIQQLFSKTWSVACRIDLGELFQFLFRNENNKLLFFVDPNTPMVLPGEHTEVHLTLLWKMVMTEGQSFTVRENNKTVATGVITKTLPSVEVSRSLGKLEL